MSSTDRIFLLIAIVACILGCVADELLLYSARGNFHTGDFLFFEDISTSRIYWGYFLGILVIPLELLGFHVVVKNLFQKESMQKTLFFLGICYLFVLGVVYHGIVSYLALIEKSQVIEPVFVEMSRQMHDPLVAILTLIFLALAFASFLLIRKQGNNLPKWLLFFNPLFVYIAVAALYFVFPLIGNYFMVAGLNFSILIFFLAFWLAVPKSSWVEE